MIPIILCLVLSLFATLAEAGSISRPAKSFGGSSFINGVVPQASDFNGDVDTVYSEFNGNIDNSNLKTTAAIAPTKINPDGFTVNIRTIAAAPCTILDESDQGADLKRWETCSNGGVFQLGTYSDANALQNNWLTITRANGGFTIGGTSGTNIVNGATTFNQAVTFIGATSLVPSGAVTMYMGTTAPAGWLLMDGASNSCTGASAANASLCAQLVSLFSSVNYKGAAAATITVDTSSDEIIHTGHGKSAGDRVHFSSTTTLPAPLSVSAVYCIESTTTDRFKIATTCGGADVDITDTGTGTHSDYFNFLTPDPRGRVPVGSGTGAGLTSRTIGATGGAEDAIVVTHNHTLNDSGHTHQQNAVNSTGALTDWVRYTGAGGSSTWQSNTINTNGSTGLSNVLTDSSVTGITLDPAGSSGTGANMDPFLVMTYIIKL
jgi:microcystin-dependent protein